MGGGRGRGVGEVKRLRVGEGPKLCRIHELAHRSL